MPFPDIRCLADSVRPSLNGYNLSEQLSLAVSFAYLFLLYAL